MARDCVSRAQVLGTHKTARFEIIILDKNVINCPQDVRCTRDGHPSNGAAGTGHQQPREQIQERQQGHHRKQSGRDNVVYLALYGTGHVGGSVLLQVPYLRDGVRAEAPTDTVLSKGGTLSQIYIARGKRRN